MSWKNKLKKNEEMFGWGQEDGSETDYSEEREAMQASHDKSHSELKQVLMKVWMTSKENLISY